MMLLKMDAYIKSYDGETKWMYFSVEDNELIKKINDIWNEVSSSMNKEFDEATDFHSKKMPKVGSN